MRRGRGVRRGQNCENIEQDTRKRVSMHCFYRSIVQAEDVISRLTLPRSDDSTPSQPPVIRLRNMSRMWRPDGIS